uniref:KN motif and ankyrin repeat domains 4 n=1 Tax=Erpetoichthys calabaricus TaxID=27687 RepID=A0A8C4X8K8_ERPCA
MAAFSYPTVPHLPPPALSVTAPFCRCYVIFPICYFLNVAHRWGQTVVVQWLYCCSPTRRQGEECSSPGGPPRVPGQAGEVDWRRSVVPGLVPICVPIRFWATFLMRPNAPAQCLSLVYQEWFGVSSQKRSSAGEVSHYLQELVAISAEMVEFVVNLADGNGNTALHYSVSHSNFDIITLLLDTGVCQVDCQNKAGYTAIMLVSLAVTESQKDMEVALKLLKQGDINARASQAGQTALMLAASHGRVDMARALLECCANVNVRDNKGRSALLRASEHGHLDMVRLLLAQPACDVQISDSCCYLEYLTHPAGAAYHPALIHPFITLVDYSFTH